MIDRFLIFLSLRRLELRIFKLKGVGLARLDVVLSCLLYNTALLACQVEDLLDRQGCQVDPLRFEDRFKLLHLVKLCQRDQVVHKDIYDVVEDQRRAVVLQLLPAQPRTLQKVLDSVESCQS